MSLGKNDKAMTWLLHIPMTAEDLAYVSSAEYEAEIDTRVLAEMGPDWVAKYGERAKEVARHLS